MRAEQLLAGIGNRPGLQSIVTSDSVPQVEKESEQNGAAVGAA